LAIDEMVLEEQARRVEELGARMADLRRHL
jgi:hypothetical protein